FEVNSIRVTSAIADRALAMRLSRQNRNTAMGPFGRYDIGILTAWQRRRSMSPQQRSAATETPQNTICCRRVFSEVVSVQSHKLDRSSSDRVGLRAMSLITLF